MRKWGTFVAAAIALTMLTPTTAHAAPIPGLRQVFDNALRYNLVSWFPTHTAASTADLRPNGEVAYALAVSLTGAYDPTTIGVPAEQAHAAAVQLIAEVARGQHANRPGGWGHNWESAYWAYLPGRAAQLLGAVTPQVRRMVADEADYQLTTRIRYYVNRNGEILTPGDSGAEENAWNATICELAAQVLPQHLHVRAWRQRAHRDRVAALARPSDLAKVRWLGGWNVAPNGTLKNHYRTSPHYMAATLALVGKPTANAKVVWEALTGFYREDGTVRGPKDDWGTGIVVPYLVADAVMGNTKWLDIHTARLAAMQARYADGHAYADAAENKYRGREQVLAGNLAQGWMALKVGQNAVGSGA